MAAPNEQASEELTLDDAAITTDRIESAKEKKSGIAKLIAPFLALWEKLSVKPWIAHLIRMIERFNERLGSQFAAAITYFSFLSLIPILIAGFGIAGLVLAGQPALLEELKAQIADVLATAGSEDMASSINKLIDTTVNTGGVTAITGIGIALVTGTNWMGNLRQAIRAQWRPQWEQDESEIENFFLALAKDLFALVVLGVGILLSVVMTLVSSSATGLVAGWLGLDDVRWVTTLLTVVPILMAIVVSTLIFFFLFRFLPRPRNMVPVNKVWRGAIFAAVFFEILKQALALIVSLLSGNATAAVFGSVIILLLIINLVGRMVLMVAAWIATSVPVEEESEADRVAVVIRPQYRTRNLQAVVGAVGVGAGAGWLARMISSRLNSTRAARRRK